MVNEDIYVCGLGATVSSNRVTNAEFEPIVDTSDTWIAQRTGIATRAFCNSEENSATLATDAAERAIEDSGLSVDQIDIVVCATVSPHSMTPSNASRIVAKLGCRPIPAFDISAACTGFLFAVDIAMSYLQSSKAKTALVVGAEALSRCLDFSDRCSCILFGDAAGAAILKTGDSRGHRIISCKVATQGDPEELVRVPGNTIPHQQQGLSSEFSAVSNIRTIGIEGREVFRFAIEAMQRCIMDAVEEVGLSVTDIDIVVPHQVNTRVFDAVAERLNFPREKIFTNIQNYGNTSAASIPLALADANESKILRDGQIVCLVGFGGGLTCGSSLIRW